MQVTRSLQNNMSIKWARPAEENICCSLQLFLHIHNLELQFLEKKHTTSMFWLATSKLRLAFPQVLRNLLTYQTKIHQRRLGSILSSFIIPANEKWQNLKVYRRKKKKGGFYHENKNASQRQVLLSQHVFLPHPPSRPRQICIKKKKIITCTNKTSLQTKPPLASNL